MTARDWKDLPSDWRCGILSAMGTDADAMADCGEHGFAEAYRAGARVLRHTHRQAEPGTEEGLAVIVSRPSEAHRTTTDSPITVRIVRDGKTLALVTAAEALAALEACVAKVRANPRMLNVRRK